MTRRQPPRGNALVRHATEGQFVDKAADAYFRVTDALVKLGRTDVPSMAAETRARSRAFRAEMKAEVGRNTFMDHGVQMLDDDDEEEEAAEAAEAEERAHGGGGGGRSGGGPPICCRRPAVRA